MLSTYEIQWRLRRILKRQGFVTGGLDQITVQGDEKEATRQYEQEHPDRVVDSVELLEEELQS